ncbi:hypothetical protein [Thiomicrospira pelophila]|uniref:hypothetical protein n=1 Tax=Thiomicrospira pelophila TaxID=934 RepID=UPI0004A6D2B8|nr:hypothetical protein [Thiomicrospira pelophila]
MSWDWIITFAVSAVTGALSGLAVPMFIERYRSKLVIRQEEIKNQLKKSEFFFEHQYLAAQEFSSFFYGLLPQKHHFADKWDDVMKHLSSQLPDHGEFLSYFLEKYDVLLSEVTIAQIAKAKTVVYAYIDEETEEAEIVQNYPIWLEKKALGFGDQFYQAVEQAHKALRNELRKQIK